MPTLSRGEAALLRGDVVDTLLAMRCTFERYTVTGEDAYGQPSGTWSEYLPDTPCWWSEDADVELAGPDINALVSTQRIVLAANTDVRASDRVKRVVGVDGTQIKGQLEIREVILKVAETVLIVREVGSP